jgi:hypothetical protein
VASHHPEAALDRRGVEAARRRRSPYVSDRDGVSTVRRPETPIRADECPDLGRVEFVSGLLQRPEHPERPLQERAAKRSVREKPANHDFYMFLRHPNSPRRLDHRARACAACLHFPSTR